jgi:hypothetical protein
VETEALEQFSIEEFRKNIISAIGDNAVALSAFIRIADVVVDKSISTACITLEGVPEIHVNPDFVMKHAVTPEHQFIMIYHEIMHMILRHGIKIRSKNDNIIADALINAMICMQYPQTRYTRFFTNFYDERKFPENLLRPYSKFKKFTHRQKYRRLYSYFSIPWDDLSALFEEIAEEKEEKGEEIDEPTLLGDHENQDQRNGHGDEVVEPIAKRMESIIKKALEEEMSREEKKIEKKYYRKANPDYSEMRKEISNMKSQGFATHVFLKSIKVLKKKLERKREIEKALIEQSRQSISSKIETALKGMFPRIPLMTPIPNLRDRSAVTAMELGLYKPFYRNPMLPKDYGVCSIYLDVSGSMGGYVKLVYKVATDCQEYLEDKIHLFSNVISSISKEELPNGVMKSTGGTDFDIIIAHMAKTNTKKAVIFTDGCANISQHSKQTIKKYNMSIITVLTPDGQAHVVNEFSNRVIKIDQNGDIK